MARRKTIAIPAVTTDIPINARRVLVALKNAVEALQGGVGTSASSVSFGSAASAGAPSHQTLDNLQGGDGAGRYHLTEGQHSALLDGQDNALHGHAADRNRLNHTGVQGWNTVTKTGSALSHLESRDHVQLNNVAGSPEGFHVGSAQYTELLRAATPFLLVADAIDPANGAWQYRTITGATTLTFAATPMSYVTLELINPGTNVSWGAMVKWPGGVAPTLTTTGTDLLRFDTRTGTEWHGRVLSLDSR